MKILVFLESTIDAFRISDNHISELQNRFPLWEFIRISSEDELKKGLSKCDLLITWHFKSEWYNYSPKLQAIFTPAAGHDWIARESRVSVFHGSFHGQIMSESLMSMILFFNRKIKRTLHNQNLKTWERNYLSDTHSLSFQHALIVGFGSIGRVSAQVLKSFGCQITGVKRSSYNPVLDKYADNIISPDKIDQFISQVDHVISFLPGGKETNDFFTRSFFKKMKDTSIFYNLGRGNCYNENDLVWSLENSLIAGAGLDVFSEEPLPESSPLWNFSNVIIMPHGSAICNEYISMYITELICQLNQFYNNKQ